MKLARQLFSLILIVGASIKVAAQKIETSISWLTTIPDAVNNISYNPARKLAIADFKGDPNMTTDAVAITSSGFMFNASFHSVNGKASLAITVYCSFNKNESWMKEKGRNAYILAHEQRHFDISYLSTLQFIKKLKQVKFNQDEYMDQLKDIYKEVVESMREMQNQYDEETHNGINTAKQEEWNTKIANKLSAAAAESIL